jgi:hypothetical protein
MTVGAADSAGDADARSERDNFELGWQAARLLYKFVIPSASRGTPLRALQGNAAGSLDFARDDGENGS